MDNSLGQTLSRSRLLAGLSVDLVDDLVLLLDPPREVPAGEIIKKRSESNRAAYLVCSGNVQVVEGDGVPGSGYSYTVGQGGLVGLTAFLLESDPVLEYRAAEESLVATLPADALEGWLARSNGSRDRLTENVSLERQYHLLRKTRLFPDLTALDLFELVQELSSVFEHNPSGDFLCHEGSEAKSAFLVASGEYLVIKESADGTPVATLAPGALTGIAGILQYGRYNAGLKASGESECWCLSKELLDRFRTLSGIIDSRIEKELALPRLKNDALLFQPDRGEGARLILELLRKHPNELWQRYRYNHQTDHQVLDILREASGFDVLYPSEDLLIDMDLPKRFPADFSRSHQLLPIFYDSEGVQVLASTPYLGSLLNECRLLLGSSVRIRLTEPGFLENLIDNTYRDIDEMDDTHHEEHSENEWQQLESLDDLEELAQAAPVIKLVSTIFSEAISRKVSDIHLDPGESRLDVRYRIDGMLRVVNTIPGRYHPAVISRIKILADLDIAERRLPQDGRIALRHEGRSFDLRVATVPTVHGESVVMRILDKSSVRVSLEDLEMGPAIDTGWQALIERANGIILVTGPTGSGKTTTLYATINEVSTPEVNVITVEDPVEYQLEGIKQIQVNAKIDLTFASVLRSILRLDPDIILVGEIRDMETAEIAAQAALTGHLVFSTLHTNDTATAITRLVEMGVDPYLVASTVIGVLAQRLVRQLCTDCRTQQPDGSWHAPGCRHCDYSGFRGRLGIYELMPMSDEIRKLVMEGASGAEIARLAESLGMKPLLEDGLSKVAEGLTTREEVFRVGH